MNSKISCWRFVRLSSTTVYLLRAETNMCSTTLGGPADDFNPGGANGPADLYSRAVTRLWRNW